MTEELLQTTPIVVFYVGLFFLASIAVGALIMLLFLWIHTKDGGTIFITKEKNSGVHPSRSNHLHHRCGGVG